MSARLHPDLILMDLQMPSMSGIEAIQQIRAGNAEVPIGVLSVFETHQYVETAVNVGASGYRAKDATPSDFCEAASALPQGKRNLVAIPHGLMAGLEASAPARCWPRLTGRELEVLRVLSTSAGNAEIVRNLGISPKTR